jgi:hypothetical protein
MHPTLPEQLNKNERTQRRALIKKLIKQWTYDGGTSQTPTKQEAGKMVAFTEWLIDSGNLK